MDVTNQYANQIPANQYEREKGINQKPNFLEQVDELIQENMDQVDFSVHCLSQALGLSRMQVHRKIKSCTNQSTTHYIRSQRLAQAKILLRESDYSVTRIAFEVGFYDLTYFSRCFRTAFGRSPSEYRRE